MKCHVLNVTFLTLVMAFTPGLETIPIFIKQVRDLFEWSKVELTTAKEPVPEERVLDLVAAAG